MEIKQLYPSSGSDLGEPLGQTRQCLQVVASLLVIHTDFVVDSTEGRVEILNPGSVSSLWSPVSPICHTHQGVGQGAESIQFTGVCLLGIKQNTEKRPGWIGE